MHGVLPAAEAGLYPVAFASNALFAFGVVISSEFFTGLGAVASIAWALIAASREARAWLDRQ